MLTSKTYEELPRLDNAYIHKDASQLGTDNHKLGKTVDDKSRESGLNTSLVAGGKMIYVRPSTNGKLLEDNAKHVLKRYHIAREHYNCRPDHTADVFDILGIVLDTLSSSRESISRQELMDRVIEKFQETRV
jgi:hypothetical protein